MNIQDDVRSFVIDTFLFGEDDGLKDDSSFLAEGIVDSTGIMQLVSFLQERYLVSIEDEELIPDNLDSIKRVTLFIEEKMRAVKLASGISA
jgi:acyl carrier protein